MHRVTAPNVASALLAASSVSFSVALIVGPDPFATGSALLLVTGVWLYTLIAIAGILLVGAPWARWLGLGTTIAALVFTAITGFESGLAIVAIGIGLAAVAGLAGPWLTLWLRQQAGTGPEPKATALPLVALGAPVVAGIAAWHGLTVGVAIAAVLGPVAAWGYARSDGWGLWVLRIAYPLTTAIAAFQLEAPGAALVFAHGLAVAVLAWSKAASRAQRSIAGPLPAPRYRRSKP